MSTLSTIGSSTSMATLGGFSGGVSKRNSMMPWGRCLSQRHDAVGTSGFVSEHIRPGVRFRMAFEQTSQANQGSDTAVLLRALCHILIEKLPDEDMATVLEGVQDTYGARFERMLPGETSIAISGPSSPVSCAPAVIIPFDLSEE